MKYARLLDYYPRALYNRNIGIKILGKCCRVKFSRNALAHILGEIKRANLANCQIFQKYKNMQKAKKMKISSSTLPRPISIT